MKRLSELGISSVPWSLESYAATDTHYVIDYLDQKVGVFCKEKKSKANARLIAAAPNLYDCLREAVVEKCEECHSINDYESDISIEWEMCKYCYVKKWRAALAEAAGEEVSDGQ